MENYLVGGKVMADIGMEVKDARETLQTSLARLGVGSREK